MSFTPNEVEMMKELAASLGQCAKKIHQLLPGKDISLNGSKAAKVNRHVSEHGNYIVITEVADFTAADPQPIEKDNIARLIKDAVNNVVIIIPCFDFFLRGQFNDMFRRLLFDKPEIAKKLETKYYSIANAAKRLGQIHDTAKQANEIVDLAYQLNSLAQDFRVCAEMAERDLAPEKPTGTKQKKRGPSKKHSEDKVKAAKTLCNELQGEGKSVNECWFEVHKKLGFKTPEAAKQAVYRFNKQNKKHN